MINPLAMFRAARAVVVIVRDPSRLEEVFSLADSLANPEVLETLAQSFAKDPEGARALREMPRIGRLDLAELRKLPVGTLGREFAEHMIANGLDPSALPTRPSKDAHEYVQAHLYETHDVWHAVTGFGSDVASELGLQAFYLAQVNGPLPIAILSAGMLNTFLFRRDDAHPRMSMIARGWLLGKRARSLFGVRWAELWSTPLAEVRAMLGVDVEGVDAALSRGEKRPTMAREATVEAAA